MKFFNCLADYAAYKGLYYKQHYIGEQNQHI